MDKPTTMSVKEYLIKRLSVRTNTLPKIIEAVVSHQMEGVNKALQKDNVFSVEMSGFGKWIFNYRKAQKKMEKQLSKREVFSNILKKPDLTEKQKASYQLKLDNTNKWIEEMEPKLQKCQQLQNILKSSLKDSPIQMTS